MARDRAGRRWGLLVGLWVALGAPRVPAQSVNPIEDYAVTDGVVEAVVEGSSAPGGLVYFGGSFGTVAPPTGAFAPLKTPSGGLVGGFPKVDGGTVYAAVADGAGGWIVGGDFSKVRGAVREGLAHILSDGRVANWAPRVRRGVGQGRVYALERVGQRVFVGGDFDTIEDPAPQSRGNLAAIDLVSGLVLGFPAQVDQPVRALKAFGGFLYAGGEFNQANPGAFTRSRAAAFDLASGSVAPSWNPIVTLGAGSPVVTALEASAGAVYLGGTFGQVGGQPRTNLAAVDPAPGPGAPIVGFIPDPNGDVLALALTTSGQLHVGGRFGTISGAGRSYLAVLDASSAAALPWNPRPDAEVTALALDGPQAMLYVGGRFTNVGAGADARRRGAAYDVANHVLGPWEANAVGPVLALAVSVDASSSPAVERVGVGGAFAGAGGVVRRNAAAIDTNTGVIAGWNPDPSGPVLALELEPGPPPNVFLGGSFFQVNGLPRFQLAKVNSSTGADLGWSSNLSGATPFVAAIGHDGATGLYIGGSFTSIGGNACNNFARIDANVSNTLAWCGQANAVVEAILPGSPTTYVGGDFTSIGAGAPQSRNRLAAVAAATGAAQGFHGNADANVKSISFSTDIFAGGTFLNIGNTPAARNRAGAVTTAGAPTAWNPNANAPVAAVLASGGGQVYLGGAFTTLKGTISRAGLAQLDTVGAGSVLAWNPTLGGFFGVGPTSAEDIGPGIRRLHTGGDFLTVNGALRSGLAGFCLEPAPPSPPSVVFVGPNIVRLTWAGSAPSWNLYRKRGAGPLALLANVIGNNYDDTSVEGGVSYNYVLRAVNGCESDASPATAAVTPTGLCGLPPDFDGISLAEQETSAGTCTVKLDWPPANAPCGGSVTYSVYRGNAPGFVVDVNSRIATLVAGTGYVDTAALSVGTWYYVVRAQETLTGEEDTNLIYAAATVAACATTAPEPVKKLTTRSNGAGAASADNTLTWVNPPGPAGTCGKVTRKLGSDPTGPADGTDLGCQGIPNTKVELLDPGLGAAGDYRYAVFGSVGGVAPFAAPAFTRGRPGPSDNAVWKYTTGASALVTAGVIPNAAYFTVSNDRLVHGMTSGTAGGFWPTVPAIWIPHVLNGPSQGRPTVVSLSSGLPAPQLILVGSSDSSVTAIDGHTGGLLWRSVLTGEESVLAPLGAMFTDFFGAYDLVFAATRNSAADNSIWAFALTGGGFAWQFKPGPAGMGVVHGGMVVDYATNRLFWTSRARAGGSANTVWCRQFTAVGTSNCPGWTGPGVAVGDSDSAPSFRNGRLYVSTISGDLVVIDAANGNVIHNVPGVGAAKGGIWTRTVGSDTELFLSTGTDLVAYRDRISPPNSPLSLWTTPGLVSASAPLLANGKLYVGTAGGQLRAFDVTTGVAAGTRTLGGSILGSPTRDSTLNLLLVGGEDGIVYAIPVF